MQAVNRLRNALGREAALMDHEELTANIDAYLEDNWEAMVGDIETLVRIPASRSWTRKPMALRSAPARRRR